MKSKKARIKGTENWRIDKSGNIITNSKQTMKQESNKKKKKIFHLTSKSIIVFVKVSDDSCSTNCLKLNHA
jgi:hypothetical protein